MWTLSKSFTFEAAHRLPYHTGKCSRLHGHSWRLTIYVASDQLIESGSESGMVMDYGSISKVVKPLIEGYLDHYYLNETLGIESPTSEAIARWIAERIKPDLPLLTAVEIAETCTCSCVYHVANC